MNKWTSWELASEPSFPPGVRRLPNLKDLPLVISHGPNSPWVGCSHPRVGGGTMPWDSASTGGWGKGWPGGPCPPILGQTRLEAPPVFSQLWLGGGSPSSLHTVGLRPSSCAHPGMTSVPAGMGGPGQCSGNWGAELTHLARLAASYFPEPLC